MMDDPYGDDNEGEVEMEGGGSSSGGGGSSVDASLVHSVSHMLAVDLCNPMHLAVASAALSALEASPRGRARLAVLHNPKGGPCALSAAAAWSAVLSADAVSTPATFGALRTLLALLNAVRLGSGMAANAPNPDPNPNCNPDTEHSTTPNPEPRHPTLDTRHPTLDTRNPTPDPNPDPGAAGLGRSS